MARIIITDSTSYLSQEYTKKNNIFVVPLNVHFGNEEFKEGTYSNRDYYNKLRTKTIFPSTSQPSVGEFLEVYEKLESGDEAFVVVLSSVLSGTYQSSYMAKDLVTKENVNIHLIDSKSSAIGLGFQVFLIQEMLNSNQPSEKIIEEVYLLQDKIKLFFSVGTLDYLVRGGRISHLSGFLGNILQLKPILSLENGEIKLFEKVRTSQKSYTKIIDILREDIDNIEKIALIHIDAFEEVKILEEKIKEIWDGEIMVTEPGPVIGSHVGPGTVGIAYY